MFPHLINESSSSFSSSFPLQRNIHTAAVSSKPFRPDTVAAAPFHNVAAPAGSLFGSKPAPGSLLVDNAFVRHDISDSDADSEAEVVGIKSALSSSSSSSSSSSAPKVQLPFRQQGAKKWTDPSTPQSSTASNGLGAVHPPASASNILLSDDSEDSDAVPEVEFVNPLAKWLPTVKNPSIPGAPMGVQNAVKSGSLASASAASGTGATKAVAPPRMDISDSEDDANAGQIQKLPSALPMRVQSLTTSIAPQSVSASSLSSFSSSQFINSASSSKPLATAVSRPGGKRTWMLLVILY
jgi:hypothetical protein